MYTYLFPPFNNAIVAWWEVIRMPQNSTRCACCCLAGTWSGDFIADIWNKEILLLIDQNNRSTQKMSDTKIAMMFYSIVSIMFDRNDYRHYFYGRTCHTRTCCRLLSVIETMVLHASVLNANRKMAVVNRTIRKLVGLWLKRGRRIVVRG